MGNPHYPEYLLHPGTFLLGFENEAHGAVGYAGVVVFRAFGDEAEAFVEGDNIGLGGEDDFVVAASTGFVDCELHDRPPHPAAAMFFEDGDTADLDSRAFVDHASG